VDPAAGEDPFEPVERQVVGVLAGRDVGEKTGARETLVEGLLRRRSGDEELPAVGAAVLLAHVLTHDEVRRDVLELLGDLFADLRRGDVALGTDPLGLRERVRDPLSAERRRKRATAVTPLRFDGVLSVGGGDDWLRRDRRRRQHWRREVERELSLGLDPLRLPTIEMMSELLNLLIQVDDEGDEILHEALELSRILGKRRRVERLDGPGCHRSRDARAGILSRESRPDSTNPILRDSSRTTSEEGI